MEFYGVNGRIAISTKHFIDATFNILYALVSIYFIKKYRLIDLAGLGKQKFKNWFLLIFPLYIILLNWEETADINYASIPTINYIAALIWCFSVGLMEELMLRGFIQSLFIKKYANTKKVSSICFRCRFYFWNYYLLNLTKDYMVKLHKSYMLLL